MIELTMPKLSDSMEEGTILTWLKADGESVQAGEDLVEIETDKATVTHPADESGVLNILASEGTTLTVGALIARLDAVGSSSTNDAPATAAPSDAQAPASSAVALEAAAARPVARTSDGSTRATPLARRFAAAHGVALEGVQGSGPLGRITRVDVLQKAGIADARSRLPAQAAAPRPDSLAASAAAPRAHAPVIGAKGTVETSVPNRLQALIARRMMESKATIPHFQVQTEVAMDAAVALRAQLKDTGAEVVPSLNNFIVKSAALALRAHPLANGAYKDGHFEQYSRVNVGIAVATDGALVVPTVFDADQRSLGAIANEAKRLASRVREGTVTPAELSGATFTVSNLGMYGMTAITPVINPGQAAILGVGAMREVLARVNGEIVDRRLLTLTLSCDHRIVYGAQAAEFLSAIRELLERPLHLAL